MTRAWKLPGLIKNPAARSIGIYTFTNFFGKAASFLLLFVFTNPNYISPSENGLLSLFSTGMLFLMPFLSMGIIYSASTDFFKMKKEEYRDFFTTGLVMAFAVMLISMIVLFLIRDRLATLYGYPAMFCWLIPLITFLTFINEQFLALVRNKNQPAVFFKANTFKIITELGISFVLVVFFAWHWQGRVAGILVAYLLTGIYAIDYIIRNKYLFGQVRKTIIKRELLYAVPTIAMQISIFCMGASDKFFLSVFTHDNNETVGIYSIASIFASVILVLSSALIQYVFPKIYEQLAAEKADFGIIKKLLWIYCSVMVMGTIALALFTPIAYKYFINGKYLPGLNYIFVLFAGYLVWTIVFFFYSFLLYFKEKKKILLLSLFSTATALALNYFFIGKWGAWGAAISTLATYLIVLLAALFFTRKYWNNFFAKQPSGL